MTSLRRFLLLLPLILVIAVGCSKSRTPCSVYGKVSYKGQPVTGGTISFHRVSEELSGSYGFPIKADGTYEGSSMPAEEYIVTVETESINKDRPIPTYSGGGQNKGIQANDYREKMKKMGKMPGVTEEQGTYVKIPAKYNEKDKSGLKVKLDNGKNKKDIDLAD
jgi:hypothetical protein